MLQNSTINKFQHFPFHLVAGKPEAKYSNSFIHTSSVVQLPQRSSRIYDILEASERTSGDTISKLALVKYKKLDEEEIKNLSSSYAESFPWFVDENGVNIDYDKSIKLFDGVKLISHFLETRYGLDKNMISDVKISEMLDIFNKKEEVTVCQLYKHVADLYNSDKDCFKTSLVENLVSSDNFKNEVIKPFGKYGDITINELAVSLKDLKWDVLINNTELTINSIPFAVNFVSYSLMLRGYMKYVHNRPYETSITIAERQFQQSIRTKNLALFSLVTAPIVLIFLNRAAIHLKDIVGLPTVNVSNSTASSSGIFLIVTKILNKIPGWLQLVFKLLFVIIIILKLLGFTSILDFLTNEYYLKMYVLITSSLVIIYQLVNLYLIHKFSKKDTIIPEILPEFVINWLKEFEILKTSKISVKEFKNMCYIQICIYLAIIVLILLI